MINLRVQPFFGGGGKPEYPAKKLLSVECGGFRTRSWPWGGEINVSPLVASVQYNIQYRKGSNSVQLCVYIYIADVIAGGVIYVLDSVSCVHTCIHHAITCRYYKCVSEGIKIPCIYKSSRYFITYGNCIALKIIKKYHKTITVKHIDLE